MNLGKQSSRAKMRIGNVVSLIVNCSAIRSWSRLFAGILAASHFLVAAPAPEVKRNSAPENAGEIKQPAESQIHYATVAFKPDNRRDPFFNPVGSNKKSKAATDEEMARGPAPPGISGTYIAQAVLKGISIQDSVRTAIMRGADNRLYFLREGDRLFDGYVKSIDTEFVTLVRETKMKSGKTLTQDVIMRLRTP